MLISEIPGIEALEIQILFFNALPLLHIFYASIEYISGKVNSTKAPQTCFISKI